MGKAQIPYLPCFCTALVNLHRTRVSPTVFVINSSSTRLVGAEPMTSCMPGSMMQAWADLGVHRPALVITVYW
ncbi:hypothetical protein LMH87_007192 [Akanthomyces muscarius]|uniref:Uncharacterized protein n=1 Tax=Akanthomyces muscarius TaxID=2231603 RepID=A0A9W8UTX8_AKAMU|nr:hypothetical protein LMH87_007192 [Akanthomyces muscarius]KAJ4165564.1 hypothetical protein LMH87_007192 [Akanthomyces muscarius]